MMAAWFQRIHCLATWPMVALLVVGFILCLQGFAWRQRQLGSAAEVPDVRFGYSPEEIRAVFENWGPDGRRLYAVSQLTLDVAFPVIYATLFAICISRLYPMGWAKVLVLIPAFAGVADLGENLLLAALAWTHDGGVSAWVWVATALTVLKFGAFVVSLLVLLVGGFIGLRQPVPALHPK